MLFESVFPEIASSHLQLPQSCDLTVCCLPGTTEGKSKTRWTNASARAVITRRWEHRGREGSIASFLEEGHRAPLDSKPSGPGGWPAAQEPLRGLLELHLSFFVGLPLSLLLSYGTYLGLGALPGFPERCFGWDWHHLPSASCLVVFLSGPKLWVSHVLGKKKAGFFLRNSCQAMVGREQKI